MKGIHFVSFILLVSCSLQHDAPEFDYGIAKYVDPFIGTAGHGHVYPGAAVPFGAVQLSPDNGTQGWDWCSGYNYSDSTIVGFSHTHLSGTGIGDLCDILLMPAIGSIDLTRPVNDVREEEFSSTFSHANESAKAGYYQVTLDNGIDVELTATEHCGFHSYTFPQGNQAQVILDLGYHINWDRPIVTSLEQYGETVFVGQRFSTGWAKDQRIYFALAFSEKPASIEVFDSTAIKELPVSGQKARAKFIFNLDGPLLTKVGISSASPEGAVKALDQIKGWNFEETKDQAARKWINELSRIQVSSQNDSLLRTFYTALYRTYLAPVIYSDVLGQYKAADSTIVTAAGYTRYDIFSLWDTFRAAHPLFTITQSSRVNDFIKSLLAHYDEYGLLPVWSLLGNETNTMTGYHAVPLITDAVLKGHRDFDIEKAFEAMKTSAMQDIHGTDHYRTYGYIPYELYGQSVTRSVEYAYDDWCIAQVALTMGKTDEYDYFMKRSQNYRHLFDQSTGFFRAKLKNGQWKVPFDPLLSDHNFEVAEYTEGNAWQHSWFVPHDIRALIDLQGGNEAFVDKLDALFQSEAKVTGENISADISGLIGQYAHGNEPSHHIAYLYNYAGASWKSQEILRLIMESQYHDTPGGLCGNEDCGQMSAWFVFSAMGFYPVNPAEGVYVIGTPMFDKVVIDVGDGRSFTIRTRYLTEENKFIQAATLHDEPLTRSYIRHFEIMDGGELIFEMGPQPNYLHWSDAEASPPSDSDQEFE